MRTYAELDPSQDVAQPCVVAKAFRLKLYPNQAQSQRLAQVAGTCRWLWNHLRALQAETYEREKKFVFKADMSKLLPALKAEIPWLGETSAQTLQRVCRNLELALKKSFAQGAGFPRFKVRGRSRESFYVTNQELVVEGKHARLPKIGKVKFRSDLRPEGKILSGTVSSDGDSWWLTVQCEVEATVEPVTVQRESAIGVDLGLKELAVVSDGRRFATPKHLRHMLRKLRRAQRRMERRKKGSANRLKAKAEVRRIHRKIADRRNDHAHKASKAIVAGASLVVLETLNVKGMVKNRHLARSISDAGWGELARKVTYKAEWAGVTVVRAGRFEASTQTCSACGERKIGEAKLSLSQRTFRCESCGHEADRDLNAAQNLRRIGLAMIGDVIEPIEIPNVGQALPERGGVNSPDARGDPSAGPTLRSVGRYGSMKQEPIIGSTSNAG